MVMWLSGVGVMEYLIGVLLAAAVSVFASVIGFDRDRVFYPTVLLVVATYYILFAAMGTSANALPVESAVASLFLIVAAVGFKKNLWLVAAGLAGHGVFDLVHHVLIDNSGVPVWWPGFCMAYDVVAGGILAVLLKKGSISA